jgi:hypothetical protein
VREQREQGWHKKSGERQCVHFFSRKHGQSQTRILVQKNQPSNTCLKQHGRLTRNVDADQHPGGDCGAERTRPAVRCRRPRGAVAADHAGRAAAEAKQDGQRELARAQQHLVCVAHARRHGLGCVSRTTRFLCFRKRGVREERFEREKNLKIVTRKKSLTKMPDEQNSTQICVSADKISRRISHA